MGVWVCGCVWVYVCVRMCGHGYVCAWVGVGVYMCEYTVCTVSICTCVYMCVQYNIICVCAYILVCTCMLMGKWALFCL